MASNREERQLMRQRGAASRKVQQVDFGFSFGSPQLEAPPEPPPEPPQLAPSSQAPSRKDTTPSSRLSRPSIPRLQRTPNRAGSQELRAGTAGSGKSGLSQVSVYDIPPDDEPEQRSPKRRRLSAVSEAQQTEEIQKVTRVDTGIAQTVSESSREITINGALNASASPAPTHDQIPVGAPTPEKQPSDGPPAEVPTNGVEETIHDTSLVREDVENENIKTKPAKALQRKRKKRKSVVLGPKRKSIARAAQPSQAASGPAQEDTTAQNEVTEVAAEKSPTPEQPLKRQGRRQKATPPNVEREPEGLREPQREEQSGTPVIDQSSGETAHGVEDTVGDNQALETAAEAVENNVEDEADRHDNEEPSIKRPKAKQKKTTTNQRTRPNRRRPNPEEVPEEVAQETPEVEDQPGQPETSTGRQQIRQRRERKPRGETVPVVVHRLANLDALEVDLDEESPDETAPSASANRIPSRGGVNAADVLSQICRETLEKTMSTLENSISQESNPARRAEWTRKRKAVEAFSTELGHRLFDMSEIIESNSVLAAQVKRERKEMAALRNRLMEVRKERRDIALKIDDVRRKYTEEEQVNREQDILNNSLHNLELALERSHRGRKDDAEPNPFVGLEFLLRTVAQDVSSVAPDSQGGLLNQVRSFNAQLERILKEN